MATPWCEKHQAWATQSWCNAHCEGEKAALSNRRWPCEHRRKRQWSDLPEGMRAIMRGNGERKMRHRRLDEHLAESEWASGELRAAAEHALADEFGKKRTYVPLDALQAILGLAKELQELGYQVSDKLGSMGSVEGNGTSQ